ncbi:MAG: PPC domain-containing DNA-binding protein [Nodosilinea sp.]
MQTYGLRLGPDQDLKQALTAFAIEQKLEAGIILTALGSFSQAALRFAAAPEATILTGSFELITLTGTLSYHGMHLHGTIADHQGRVYGGHLMAGCLIRTTAEIAVANLPDLRFRRELDSQTGYLELVTEPIRADPRRPTNPR